MITTMVAMMAIHGYSTTPPLNETLKAWNMRQVEPFECMDDCLN